MAAADRRSEAARSCRGGEGRAGDGIDANPSEGGDGSRTSRRHVGWRSFLGLAHVRAERERRKTGDGALRFF